MSSPQSNSTHTIAAPMAVTERTRRTPAAPLSAASIGKVTSDSISSGAIPPPSTRIVTVGAVRSGRTSTGRCAACQPPHASRIAASVRTISLLWSDQRIRASIMSGPQCTWPWAGIWVDIAASRTR